MSEAPGWCLWDGKELPFSELCSQPNLPLVRTAAREEFQ